MIFGSFSSSTFLCLGIMLVIVGVLGYLISRKFQEQNHKIATMCELVTTMAQDLQMLKMQNAVDKIQHTLNVQSGSVGGFGNNVVPFSSGGEVAEVCERVPADFDKLNYEPSSIQHKIVVSDDEESYGNDDGDDDDETDASTLEEFEDENDDNEDSDDDIEITEITENQELQEQESAESVDILLDEEFPAETKHIDIVMDAEELVDHRQHHATQSDAEAHPHIVVNKLGSIPSPIPFSLDDSIELSTPTFTDNPMASGVLNKPKKTKPSRTSTTADELAEGMEGLENFTGDYSKLNVAQLRKLVTDRGLSTHATKLKKTELLQLLGGSATVVELDGIDL
jgi:hypothetical protein